MRKLRADSPEGHVFVDTAEMTSLTKDLEHITLSPSGNHLVLATDLFPLLSGPSDPNPRQSWLRLGSYGKPQWRKSGLARAEQFIQRKWTRIAF